MPDMMAPILPHVPAFLLVLFRLAGLFIFAPMFGSSVIPMRIRLFLALALSLCIYPIAPVQAPPLSLISLPFVCGSEMLIGLIIGFGASLPLVAVQMGGLMMGHQIGLGLARVINPDTEEQTEILSQLMFMAALVIFMLLDGHHILIHALVRSFHNIPLGGYRPDGSILQILTGMLGTMFDLAMRLAAPLLCLIFLETIAMGFVARTVPQLNILSLGFPLRILVGLLLIISISAVMYEAVAKYIIETLNIIMRFF